jgi:hypothetical protein
MHLVRGESLKLFPNTNLDSMEKQFARLYLI